MPRVPRPPDPRPSKADPHHRSRRKDMEKEHKFGWVEGVILGLTAVTLAMNIEKDVEKHEQRHREREENKEKNEEERKRRRRRERDARRGGSADRGYDRRRGDGDGRSEAGSSDRGHGDRRLEAGPSSRRERDRSRDDGYFGGYGRRRDDRGYDPDEYDFVYDRREGPPRYYDRDREDSRYYMESPGGRRYSLP